MERTWELYGVCAVEDGDMFGDMAVRVLVWRVQLIYLFPEYEQRSKCKHNKIQEVIGVVPVAQQE